MSRVIGSASEARSLKNSIRNTRNGIVYCLADLSKEGKSIESAWKDEGNKEIQEIVRHINKALQETESDFDAAERGIEKYAAFLESLGRP